MTSFVNDRFNPVNKLLKLAKIYFSSAVKIQKIFPNLITLTILLKGYTEYILACRSGIVSSFEDLRKFMSPQVS